MADDRQFQYKKVQIEKFLKEEFHKKFRPKARISVRKRQRFIEDMTRKVGKRFGKDVMFLLDFNRNGFSSVLSPARSESTEKGKIFRSFIHPQVYYTSHCVDRFSERDNTHENCVIALDGFMTDALLSFGENEGHLTFPEGVFAYELENDRLIVKTFINFEMLTDDQIKKFYGPGMIATFPKDFIAENSNDSDFLLQDEFTHHMQKPQS
jgi:hypothetical protein